MVLKLSRLHVILASVAMSEGIEFSLNEIWRKGWTTKNRELDIYDYNVVEKNRELGVYDRKNLAFGYDYRKRSCRILKWKR